jgi:hypothetical protein
MLNYAAADAPVWRDWAERLPWLVTGGAGFCVVALALFLAALWWRAPNVMMLYPAMFVAAVLASTDHRPRTRSVAVGMVLGSVFMSTIGYAAGLILLVKP